MSEISACKHQRTQLIAKDSDAEYFECLDCGLIFEAQEMVQPSNHESAGFDESPSDA
jgi:hypothetical protein